MTRNKMRIACFLERENIPSETFITKEIEAFRSFSAEVDIFPIIRKYNPAYYFRPYLLNQANKKYDIVLAHYLAAPSREAYRLFGKSDIPLFISCHANDIFTYTMPKAEKKRLLKRADGIITCCQGNLAYLKDEYPEFKDKINLFYHGVKIDFAECPQHDFFRNESVHLLFVGRLVEKKGVLPFINLLKEARSSIKRKIRLTIIGSGPEEEAILRAATNSGFSEDITFLPFTKQDELTKYYLAADFLVFPSIIAKNNDRDGLSNVILEAFAHGLPVIATPINGTLDAVKDNETGFLFDHRNTEKIIEILNNANSEKLSAIAKNSFSIAKNQFDHKITTKQLYDFFSSVLG